MKPSSAVERLLHWESTVPDDIFLRQPFNGIWKTRSFRETADECRRLAAALLASGLQKGDHVAILSKNCAEWVIADIALMMAGMVSIPIYPTLTAPSIRSILEHSGSKAIIAGKLDNPEQQLSGVPEGVMIIGVETYGTSAPFVWEKMIADAAPLSEMHAWNREDIITIVYTSGTTGVSKGVMHSLDALDTVVQKAISELDLPQRPHLFSYLPMSHIAERMGIELNGIYTGSCTSFAESLDTFADNLANTQPHLFFAVPRIWIKFREKILQKIPQKKMDTLLAIPLVSSLIKKSIRKKLGLSRATYMVSAAAPIAKDVLLWYEKLGITIFQAYGMTEDCVYAHFNRKNANKFGTVGKPLAGLEVKISGEGEIRVKSKGNMKGYYREPTLTAEMFDEEGYLRTGDIGEIDPEGYLTITGRLKDQFKTDKGKYISPAPIETLMLNNHNLEQVCIVGTGIPQPIAMVTISDSGKMMETATLHRQLEDQIKNINQKLEKHEKLQKVVILEDTWTIENGLLTPTLKVKRNELEKIYLERYSHWYQMAETVIRDK